MIFRTVDLIKRSYLEYRRLLLNEQGPFELVPQTEPREGEIRIFGVFPPVYLLITERLRQLPDIFKVIPLSEEVKLSYLGKATPMFVFNTLRMCLCALPLEFYAEKRLLFNYTTKIAKTEKNSIKVCKHYVITTAVPGASYQGKFINLEKDRLLRYGLSLEKEDAVKEEVVVVSDELASWIEQEYGYMLSATPKQVLKGKNFYGIAEMEKEQANLIMYLPEELKGREVEIKIGKVVIFQGLIRATKLVLKNFPKLPDYSFLEEDLSVQVRKL